jgi:hypothetical protein
MDWNVLGTWAAVVVALGISLKDTFARWRERSARHLLVAAQILPSVGQLTNALRKTLAQAEHVAQTSSTDTAALRASCAMFLGIFDSLGLKELRGYADQVDALPEHLLIPLVKAMTMMQMLAHNGQIQQHQFEMGQRISLGDIRVDFQESQEQANSVLRSLEWVERGVQRQLTSKRWTNPELPMW